jgi:hypothetical protein
MNYGYGSLLSTYVDGGTFWYGYGLKVNQPSVSGSGSLRNYRGIYVGDMNASSTSDFSIYTNAGDNHFGDDVEVAGNVNPTISGTYNLGSSALSWHEVHANQFVTHSYGDLSDGVKLRDGRVVSCTVAVSSLKRGKNLTASGLPHMDYEASDFPIAAYVPARDEWRTREFTSTTPVAGSASMVPMVDEKGNFKFYTVVVKELLKGQPGADMDVMQSIFLCAQREMDAKNKAIEATLADLDKRLKQLESTRP